MKDTTDNKANSHRVISAYLASASAGVIQTSLFHPLDTMAKRLQTNKPVNSGSIWRGFSAALTYRVVACTIGFGTQPLVKRQLEMKYGHAIAHFSGEKYKSTVTHGLAGSIFALVDVGFLPLDRWKVLRQLNNTLTISELVQAENHRLFKGASVTALRNIKSYFALFAASEAISVNFFAVNMPPSFSQRFIAAFVGATVATIASNPTDVIKTCLQHNGKSAIEVAKHIYTSDGLKGFMRGITPRLFSIVPRLTLLKSMSEHLAPIIDSGISRLAKSRR